MRVKESQHLMRLHPHIVALEQPVELRGGERNHLFLEQPKPVILLVTLDHLVPDGEAVTIPIRNLYGIESTAPPPIPSHGAPSGGLLLCRRRFDISSLRSRAISWLPVPRGA